MRVADRAYFFVVGAACAVGWLYRIWPLPLLAFAVLEGVSASAGRRPTRRPEPVRLHLAPDPGEPVADPFDQAA
jgi:membrane protein implicated in regulation of membrane protease activity